jgi:hypothetical protein
MSGVLTLSAIAGDVYLPWRERHGETFAVDVVQENRVCICHIVFKLVIDYRR